MREIRCCIGFAAKHAFYEWDEFPESLSSTANCENALTYSCLNVRLGAG